MTRFFFRCWIFALSTTVLALLLKLEQATPGGGRIDRALASAKARGETSVQLPAAIILPTGVTTVDEVLSDYSLMLIEPLHIVVSADADRIFTWYKLKILETLVRQKQVPRDGLPENVPEELLPVADNEILLIKNGGRVVIDRITVTQRNPQDVRLLLGNKYLACLFLESDGKIGSLAASINGLFSVNKANRFTALNSRNNPLGQDIEQRYRNDLTVMREQVKKP